MVVWFYARGFAACAGLGGRWRAGGRAGPARPHGARGVLLQAAGAICTPYTAICRPLPRAANPMQRRNAPVKMRGIFFAAIFFRTANFPGGRPPEYKGLRRRFAERRWPPTVCKWHPDLLSTPVAAINACFSAALARRSVSSEPPGRSPAVLCLLN